MLLCQHERLSAGLQTFQVSSEQRLCGGFGAQGQLVGLDGQPGADGQAQQVVGLRQDGCLIEVVDAPDQGPSRSRQVPKFSR